MSTACVCLEVSIKDTSTVTPCLTSAFSGETADTSTLDTGPEGTGDTSTTDTSATDTSATDTGTTDTGTTDTGTTDTGTTDTGGATSTLGKPTADTGAPQGAASRRVLFERLSADGVLPADVVRRLRGED